MLMQTETYTHLGHSLFPLVFLQEDLDGKKSWGSYGYENCIVPMPVSLSFIKVPHKYPLLKAGLDLQYSS